MVKGTRVMAVDAGKSTGLAIVDFYDDDRPPSIAHLEQSTLKPVLMAHEIYGIEVDFTPDVIVVEQFDLRPSNQFVADLTPVTINGMLEYLFDEDIVWQTPAQAKGLVSDKVLKNLDFWPTGKDVGQPDANDARDALRHAVFYGVNELKHRPTLERGWPDAN